TAAALIQDPALKKFEGRVSDSGEGGWTIKAAIDEAAPAHVLSAALYERFSSRGAADFADKLLSAMRYELGGHLEKSAKCGGPYEHAPVGCTSLFRCHGRSRPQENLSVVASDG